jgi:plastocyanin
VRADYRQHGRVARFLHFWRSGMANQRGVHVPGFLGWVGTHLPRWGALTSLWLVGAAPVVVPFGTSGAPAAPDAMLNGLATDRGLETGRIEGVAKIAPVLTTIHRRIRVYDEPGMAPPKAALDNNPLANVVIYLEQSSALHVATSLMPVAPAALRQRDETFVPHVLPVVVGTTVQFPNDDPVFHDVFSLSSAKAFDLQRYPQGASRNVQFSKAGVVEVFCHIHADMSAYILVLENPFFVIPDAQGHFALEGVPEGDYWLTAWYERTHPVRMHVHVSAGRTTTQPMLIPLPMDALPHS